MYLTICLQNGLAAQLHPKPYRQRHDKTNVSVVKSCHFNAKRNGIEFGESNSTVLPILYSLCFFMSILRSRPQLNNTKFYSLILSNSEKKTALKPNGHPECNLMNGEDSSKTGKTFNFVLNSIASNELNGVFQNLWFGSVWWIVC